jgi:hypothetical protein
MSITRRKLPELSEYERNRQLFTTEQLLPYNGQWVAFSEDGKRIVAAAPELLETDRLVTAAGEDPERVGFEIIDFRAIKLGASEFS